MQEHVVPCRMRSSIACFLLSLVARGTAAHGPPCSLPLAEKAREARIRRCALPAGPILAGEGAKRESARFASMRIAHRIVIAFVVPANTGVTSLPSDPAVHPVFQLRRAGHPPTQYRSDSHAVSHQMV
jgi:hypothetical protein